MHLSIAEAFIYLLLVLLLVSPSINQSVNYHNKKLIGYVYKNISTIGPQMCEQDCLVQKRCKSVNFDMNNYICELSNSSVSTLQANLSHADGYRYAELNSTIQYGSNECLKSNPCLEGQVCISLTNGGYICSASECLENPPVLGNGSVVITGRSVGHELTYSCNSGFVSVGSRKVTCGNDEKWSDLYLQCIELVEYCLFDSSCLVKYNFTFDNSWNNCFGDQYITKYGDLFAGIIVCNPLQNRYKLFLSNSLENGYENIGDGIGWGQNHCEIIGGSNNANINLPTDYTAAPTVIGYYRNHWGESFGRGIIGYQSTVFYYVSWYECGMNIPGNRHVVVKVA